MKKLIVSAMICVVAMMFTGCGNIKNLVYFQGIDSLDLSPSRQLYDAKIMPKDQLTIMVKTTDPEASEPFSLYSQNSGYANMGGQGQNMYSYLGDNNGDINFPVLGFIQAGPRVVSVPSESMSIIEAIASAGDISVYGKRDNILLIRQDKYGEKHSHRLNIADASILNSPYYYVQQNDIIYVEPNKQKLANTAMNSYLGAWLGAATTLISATTLVIALTK